MKMKPFSSVCFLFAIVGCFASSLVQCETLNLTNVVHLDQGQVKGFRQQLEGRPTLQFYLGLRFGHANRFEAPIAPTGHWGDVLNATEYGPGCFQFGSANPNTTRPLFDAKTYSEDCLYLNVIRPDTEKFNRSVMVWIHGGAFEVGSGSSQLYSSQSVVRASNDVIVVTVNYRLGPLGFLTDGHKVPGNLGLLDQILALKWVQKNIHSFGGNPADVTIFGESAGAISVSALVLSPLAKGLFHRAILQSGSVLGLTVTQSKEKMLSESKLYSTKAGCPTSSENWLDCLRNRSIAQLQVATDHDFTHNHLFFPLYGDEVLPVKPSEALKTGKFNRVDLLFGVTRNEGTGFLETALPGFDNQTLNVTTARQAVLKITEIYGIPHGEEVADFYMAQAPKVNASSDELKTIVGAVWGDYHITCPTILFGEEMEKALRAENQTNKNLYSYRLMQYVTIPGLSGPKWQGVTHGSDLVYLFVPEIIDSHPELADLSHWMLKAWTLFARQGHPGLMGSVGNYWKQAFDGEKPHQTSTRYMHLESGHYNMVEHYFDQLCQGFWRPKIIGV